MQLTINSRTTGKDVTDAEVVNMIAKTIKELEEESFQKRRRRSGVKRQLVFCTGGV